MKWIITATLLLLTSLYSLAQSDTDLGQRQRTLEDVAAYNITTVVKTLTIKGHFPDSIDIRKIKVRVSKALNEVLCSVSIDTGRYEVCLVEEPLKTNVIVVFDEAHLELNVISIRRLLLRPLHLFP